MELRLPQTYWEPVQGEDPLSPSLYDSGILIARLTLCPEWRHRMGDIADEAALEAMGQMADEDYANTGELFEAILGMGCSLSKVYRDYEGVYHVTASRRTTVNERGRRRVYYEYMDGRGETLQEAALETMRRCADE